jgi:starch-binding outer membrane protein, SusD/RagB family
MSLLSNIRYSILLLIAGTVFFSPSCKKLELEPTDIIDASKAFESYKDFQDAVIGAYGALTSGSYLGALYLPLTDWATDDVRFSAQTGGLGRFIHDWNYTTNDQDVDALWAAAYRVVYRCNIILENMPKLDAFPAVTQAQKDQIRGEVLAIRAMVHFDLVRLFGDRYNLTGDASHLGIPYVTGTSIVAQPARNTVKQVFDQCLQDLDDAKTLLNQNKGVYFFNATSVRALEARIYYYKRDWVNAKLAAQDVIATSGKTLQSGVAYTNMFTAAEAEGENLFKVAMTVGSARIGDNYNQRNGNINFNPSVDLVSLYDRVNDVRFATNITVIAVPPAGFPRDTLAVRKWLGPAGETNRCDIKILRLSEMYLILAESRSNLSEPDGDVLAELDEVRSARISGFVSPGETGAALVTAIAREWRKEFAFEGHRFFQVKLRGQGFTRNDCTSPNCVLAAG